MARVQERRQAIRRGEQSILRDKADEGFQRFLRPIAIEFFASESVETVKYDHGN